MAEKGLLVQDANKLLLHGAKGEKMVNHYTFFAAFPDSQEYRLRQGGKELGTLPLQGTSMCGDVITFAGRRWRIEDIDHEKRLVDLTASSMGKLPRTNGQDLPVHTRVRQEMRAVLASDAVPVWLDATAKSLLRDAQKQYQLLQLDQKRCIVEGDTVYLFLWEGDLIQSALAALLVHEGQQAEHWGICIAVKHTTPELVTSALATIANKPCPQPNEIITRKQMNDPEKWDWVLPDDLAIASYASRTLALKDAHAMCKSLRLLA
jgi:ATP-dependent Lhr-like helicase